MSTILTGVSGHFCAAHRDDAGRLHGHTWKVRAWFKCPSPADAACHKVALGAVLAQWDHTDLSDRGMMWGEDIARAVGTLVNCVEVEVSREAEGYYARWLA